MEQEIIELLRQFIAFRTVAGESRAKHECLEWLRSTFLEQGVLSKAGGDGSRKVILDEIDSSPYLYLPHPNPKLLWFAHIDVVPAEDHQFTLMRDEDRLIGRGTADMKGNQLPFLMSYRDSIADGSDPPVSILLTSDEETAGQTIPRLLERRMISHIPVAFTPDCGASIVCEHKGVVWADLVCTGKGCHAAYPWAGFNPLFLLTETLTRIQNTFPPDDTEEWRMTVTPTDIRGSDARNQIPESATCKIDIRYTPEIAASPDAALKIVKKLLTKGCTIHTHLAASALHTDRNHPMVRLVKNLAEETLKKEVQIRREPGGTDARYFGEKGIPAFLYGVEGGGIHGKEEWVSLNSLLKNYEISRKLLNSL